jgi:YVTN family beta-propeller protein
MWLQGARAAHRLIALAIACAGGAVACAEPPAAPAQDDVRASVPGYANVADVAMPGDSSRWDYQIYDAVAHRLYISHLGASQIVAFDTAAQRVAGVVPGVAAVRGLALASDQGRLYASSAGRDEVAAVDTASLTVVATVAAGSSPDGLAYAREAGRLYIANEHETTVTVIDGTTLRPLSAIAIGSDVGNAQYDADSGLVYVASGTSGRLSVLDTRTDAVVARYSLAGCQAAESVQLDGPGARRVFVACSGNAKLVTFDLTTKTVTAVMDVGAGPDLLALDPGLHRLYVASESGTLSVLDISGPTRKLAEGIAGRNAHSVAVDPDSHTVYLPLTDVRGQPVLRELRPA